MLDNQKMKRWKGREHEDDYPIQEVFFDTKWISKRYAELQNVFWY